MGDWTNTGTLLGHNDKVLSVSWASDSRHLVSAGLDGRIIIWDAQYSCKKQVIQRHASSWVLTCAFAPSMEIVVAGGMDFACSLYSVKPGGSTSVDRNPPHGKIVYSSYVTSCKFLDATRLAVSLGDGGIVLSDIHKGQTLESSQPVGAQEQTCISVNPTDSSMVASGSVDSEAYLWDVRLSQSMAFTAGNSQVNDIDFSPSGRELVGVFQDGTAKIWDLRDLSKPTVVDCGEPAYSCSFAEQVLIAKHNGEQGSIVAYDLQKAKLATIGQRRKTFQPYSCVRVTPDGQLTALSGWAGNVELLVKGSPTGSMIRKVRNFFSSKSR